MEMDSRDIRDDRSGGIEGLPLQLMIVILVATMGTAIIMGWMGSLDTPTSIGDVIVEDDPVHVGEDGLIDVSVRVLDQDGNGLEGATVVLNGLSVETTGEDGGGRTPVAVTDSKGLAVFHDLSIYRYGTTGIGFIDVMASKSGYGEHGSTRVTVVF